MRFRGFRGLLLVVSEFRETILRSAPPIARIAKPERPSIFANAYSVEGGYEEWSLREGYISSERALSSKRASASDRSREWMVRRTTLYELTGIPTQRLVLHPAHWGRNCFELRSRNATKTRSAGNVVSRERFKLVSIIVARQGAHETARSGHGVEPDGVSRLMLQARSRWLWWTDPERNWENEQVVAHT